MIILFFLSFDLCNSEFLLLNEVFCFKINVEWNVLVVISLECEHFILELFVKYNMDYIIISILCCARVFCGKFQLNIDDNNDH